MQHPPADDEASPSADEGTFGCLTVLAVLFVAALIATPLLVVTARAGKGVPTATAVRQTLVKQVQAAPAGAPLRLVRRVRAERSKLEPPGLGDPLYTQLLDQGREFEVVLTLESSFLNMAPNDRRAARAALCRQVMRVTNPTPMSWAGPTSVALFIAVLRPDVPSSPPKLVPAHSGFEEGFYRPDMLSDEDLNKAVGDTRYPGVCTELQPTVVETGDIVR